MAQSDKPGFSSSSVPPVPNMELLLSNHLIAYAEHLIRMGRTNEARQALSEAHSAQLRAMTTQATALLK